MGLEDVLSFTKTSRARAKMLRAIERAAGNEEGSMFVNKIPLIHGLRAIRDFEKINGVKFDPDEHDRYTFHMGRMRSGLCQLKKMVEALKPPTD